jgi:hypothetical protein
MDKRGAACETTAARRLPVALRQLCLACMSPGAARPTDDPSAVPTVGRRFEDRDVATTVVDSNRTEHTRRDFLFIATGAVGAVGIASAIWPFVSQMAPDAATIAAGAPVDFDLGPVAEGQIVKLFWRGKLIFVRHRTAEEIKEAEDVNLASLPDPQPDSARVKEGKSQWLIVYGNCTHL